MIARLPDWGHLRVDGPDHVRFLQGMCTIDVEKLAVGGHAWGAMLSPKGRVLAVIEATRGDDHVMIHCEPSLADKTQALLEKYAVMDDVRFERVIAAAWKEWPAPGAGAGPAWDASVVFGEVADFASAEDVEIVRVEAGIPRYGVDVDEDHFPFETPLVKMIDYGKGCYIGQEPVFRVHAQGNAARALRALIVEGDGAVAPGSPVAHAERENAGKVTSAVISPVHGPIALAYLHRTVWDPGGSVMVAGRKAIVRELPL